MTSPIAQKLLAWYAENQRSLPWRQTQDPYAVWVSEIMLQQTRVETVIPYYERWMKRFPNVEALAEAPLDDVLQLWEGLGYYRRAHYLHQAAQQIAGTHHGRLPQTVEQLRRLPGIGPYAAAAIGSIAFGQDVLALDGNLRRVLARLSDLDLDVRSPAGERRLREFGEAHLPAGVASEYNQALMDLGASICTPRSPRCHACPLTGDCLAYERGTQALRPVRRPKSELPHATRAAAAILHQGQVLLGRRPQGALLGGLWEFPGVEREDGGSLAALLKDELASRLKIRLHPARPLGKFDHSYTHFKVTVHAFACELREGEPKSGWHSELRWARPADLESYPMGKVDRAIARRLMEESASVT